MERRGFRDFDASSDVQLPDFELLAESFGYRSAA